MKPGGVLLVIAGIWVLAQVLGGNALVRLGLVSDTAAGPDVDDLIPAPPGGRKGSTDGFGRPL